MEEIKAFKARNGKIFENKEDATREDLKIILKKKEVVDLIMENLDDIKQILKTVVHTNNTFDHLGINREKTDQPYEINKDMFPPVVTFAINKVGE